MAGFASLLGTGTKAYGQGLSAQAQSTTDEYNASIAANNEQLAAEQANWAAENGEQQAGIQGLKNRAQVGGIIANQGASGVTVGTGSAADTIASARELGQLNAMTIRSNAARAAYGLQVQATNDEAQKQLDKYAAKEATVAGNVNEAGTILGGVGSASQYSTFLNSQSIGTAAEVAAL